MLASASKRARRRTVGEKVSHVLFRKSEAVRRHHEARVSEVAGSQMGLSAHKQNDPEKMSSFAPELLASANFDKTMERKSQTVMSTIPMKGLDLTSDDEQAYNMCEGKEFFESHEAMIGFTRKVNEVLAQK